MYVLGFFPVLTSGVREVKEGGKRRFKFLVTNSKDHTPWGRRIRSKGEEISGTISSKMVRKSSQCTCRPGSLEKIKNDPVFINLFWSGKEMLVKLESLFFSLSLSLFLFHDCD